MSQRECNAPTTASLRDLSDLQSDPNNANRGTTRGRDLLTSSLQAYGAGRSVVTDRAGVNLPQPTMPAQGNNTTRKSLERTVRVVDARLVQFKLEAGKDGTTTSTS